MDAVTLRRIWNDFFAERGHTLVPSASLIPTHPTAPDVHQLGDDAVRPVLPRRGAGAVRPAPGDVDPEVRAPGRQAQRHRRARPHPPPPHLLRDARQLELRRLLQARRHQVGVGARHRRAGFDGDRIWATVHVTDDDAEAIWHEEIGHPDRAHPAPGQGQLLGDGRDRPVRAVLGDPLRLRARSGARRAAPSYGGGDRYVEFWNLVFMQSFRHARRHASPTCPPRTSTPAPASSAG